MGIEMSYCPTPGIFLDTLLCYSLKAILLSGGESLSAELRVLSVFVFRCVYFWRVGILRLAIGLSDRIGSIFEAELRI